MAPINKVEAIGIFLSIAVMAVALSYFRFGADALTIATPEPSSQVANVAVVPTDGDQTVALANTIAENATPTGELTSLIVDDIQKGTGALVKDGDVVSVHYIGRLQNGQEFDNSYNRGTPFTFTVGNGQVIKGWDEGLVGMQVGGQRVLVIPPDLAYGDSGLGPIPGGATLIFAVELVEIK